MRPDTDARALRSLMLFLGANYIIGSAIGALLTHSLWATIVIAMLAPCLCVVGLGLFGRWVAPKTRPEEPIGPTAAL